MKQAQELLLHRALDAALGELWRHYHYAPEGTDYAGWARFARALADGVGDKAHLSYARLVALADALKALEDEAPSGAGTEGEL